MNNFYGLLISISLDSSFFSVVFVVVVSLFSVVNVTLSLTTIDRVGIVARTVADTIVPLLCYVYSLKHCRKVYY